MLRQLSPRLQPLPPAFRSKRPAAVQIPHNENLAVVGLLPPGTPQRRLQADLKHTATPRRRAPAQAPFEPALGCCAPPALTPVEPGSGIPPRRPTGRRGRAPQHPSARPERRRRSLRLRLRRRRAGANVRKPFSFLRSRAFRAASPPTPSWSSPAGGAPRAACFCGP